MVCVHLHPLCVVQRPACGVVQRRPVTVNAPALHRRTSLVSRTRLAQRTHVVGGALKGRLVERGVSGAQRAVEQGGDRHNLLALRKEDDVIGGGKKGA